MTDKELIQRLQDKRNKTKIENQKSLNKIIKRGLFILGTSVALFASLHTTTPKINNNMDKSISNALYNITDNSKLNEAMKMLDNEKSPTINIKKNKLTMVTIKKSSKVTVKNLNIMTKNLNSINKTNDNVDIR